MISWQQVMLSAPFCALAFNLQAPAWHVPDVAKTHLIFCAYGSYSFVSPQYHPEVAVAVVEVDSPKKIENAVISDVALIASNGEATTMTRLAKVEIFEEPFFAGEGYGEYYLDTDPASKSRRWNGILPAEKIRLGFKRS